MVPQEPAYFSDLEMGMVGIEPTLTSVNGFLRPARLPIPPHPLITLQQVGDYRSLRGSGQATKKE